MWIAPAPIPLSARFDSNWINESGNEYFILQSWGGSGVLHKLGLTINDHKYRILWQTSNQVNSELFVIACSNDREDIAKGWSWLNDNILQSMDNVSIDSDSKDIAIISRLMDVLPSDECTIVATKVEDRICALFGAIEEDLVAHTKASMSGCTRTGILALTTCRLVFFSSDEHSNIQLFHGDIEESKVIGGILFGPTLSIVSKKQEKYSFTGLSPMTAYDIYNLIVDVKNKSMKSIISSHNVMPNNATSIAVPRFQFKRGRTSSGSTEHIAFDPVCHYFKLPMFSSSLAFCTSSSIHFQSRPDQKKEDRISAESVRIHLFSSWICVRSASLSVTIPIALLSTISKSAGSLLFKNSINLVLKFDTDHGTATLKFVGMSKGGEFHAAIVHCMDYSAKPVKPVDEFLDITECPDSVVKPLGKLINSQSPTLGVAGRLDDELDVAWTDYLYSALVRQKSRAFLFKTEGLRNRIWKYGIPDRYRQLVWPLLAGLVDIQVSDVTRDNYLIELERAKGGVESSVVEEIERDLQRSLPDHPIFRDNRGLAALKRVLLVSSHRNGHHGYTQAMNMIAAVLLIHLPEPIALDVLSKCTTEWFPDTFSKSMLGGAIDQRVFEEVLCEQFSNQMSSLVSSGDVAIITFGWFVAWFANLLNVECEVRFFDVFLLDGPVAIYWFGLSIFRTALQSIDMDNCQDSEAIVLAVNDTFKQMKKNRSLFGSVLFQAFAHYSAKFPLEEMVRAKERHSLAALRQLSDRTRAGDLKRLCKCSQKMTQDEVAIVYDVAISAVSNSKNPGNALASFDMTAFKIISRQLVPWLMMFGGGVAGNLFSYFTNGLGSTMSIDTLLDIVHATTKASIEEQAGLYYNVMGLSEDKQNYVSNNKHLFTQATTIKCLY